MRPILFRTLALVSTALLVAACGGSSDDDGGSEGEAGAAGKLAHVDGTIQLQGEQLTVTPAEGGESMEFELGPEVQPASIRAIEASGEEARVTYRAGGDPVAAAVVPAPKLGEGVQSYEGTVTSVDESKLVVSGDEGERTFDISGADEGAFDAAHLEDHAAEGEPIRVYFDPAAPEVGISYEDA